MVEPPVPIPAGAFTEHPMAETNRQLRQLNEKMDKMLTVLGWINEEIAAGNGRNPKKQPV